MSELDDLRSATRGFLSTHAPVRNRLEHDPQIWKRLTTELGLMSLAGPDVPLTYVTAVLEETGRVLLRAPYLPTIVAALALPQSELSEGLSDGSVIAAIAIDGLDQVPYAEQADVLLVAEGDDLVLVEDFTATPLKPLDPTRPQARVSRGSGRVVGSAQRTRELHQVALAAESVGAAQRVLEMTVEHLLTREQFGRPLGSFQALRHRVADLTVLVESATSTLWYAGQPGTDLAVAAPLAKASAADAFVAVVGDCLQLHGGIGFTWEHELHLYFKRAWTTAPTHGDSAALRRQAFERAHAHG
jgi:hypothetical protein